MSDQIPRAKVGLEARVARVNSTTQLVLNAGREQGISPGDIFKIMSVDGVPVNDPESGEMLDTLPVEKARISVQTVYPRICIAETYRTYKIGGTTSLGVMFGPERTVKEEMEVEKSEDYPIDKTVRVGDKATLISLAK